MSRHVMLRITLRFLGVALLGSSGVALAEDVTCESQGQGQTACDMDTHGNVRLVRQLSKTACVQGENWGLSHHSIWVKDGCRAVFRNASSNRDDAERGSSHDSDRGVLLGACNVRAKAQGALVTSVPVGDDVTELIIDYPEGRFMCMTRNDGLVESLTRLRRQP